MGGLGIDENATPLSSHRDLGRLLFFFFLLLLVFPIHLSPHTRTSRVFAFAHPTPTTLSVERSVLAPITTALWCADRVLRSVASVYRCASMV